MNPAPQGHASEAAVRYAVHTPPHRVTLTLLTKLSALTLNMILPSQPVMLAALVALVAVSVAALVAFRLERALPTH